MRKLQRRKCTYTSLIRIQLAKDEKVIWGREGLLSTFCAIKTRFHYRMGQNSRNSLWNFPFSKTKHVPVSTGTVLHGSPVFQHLTAVVQHIALEWADPVRRQPRPRQLVGGRGQHRLLAPLEHTDSQLVLKASEGLGNPRFSTFLASLVFITRRRDGE